jgi:hypothetical protein
MLNPGLASRRRCPSYLSIIPKKILPVKAAQTWGRALEMITSRRFLFKTSASRKVALQSLPTRLQRVDVDADLGFPTGQEEAFFRRKSSSLLIQKFPGGVHI